MRISGILMDRSDARTVRMHAALHQDCKLDQLLAYRRRSYDWPLKHTLDSLPNIMREMQRAGLWQDDVDLDDEIISKHASEWRRRRIRAEMR